MKNLITLGCVLVGYLVKAQVNPPIVSPAVAEVNYGQSVNFTAAGCVGTVTWSDGQTGTNANILLKQSGFVWAICTVGMQSSSVSAPSQVKVNLTVSPCGSAPVLTSSISSGVRHQSQNSIVATNQVQPDASAQYSAPNFVQLNPGFEAKNGSVFTTFLKPCHQFYSLRTRAVTTGLQYPWEILWGPDNFIWMTERPGTISRVNPVSGQKTVLLTINEVTHYGEGGLLGMVLHPDFGTNPYVYVVYNYGPPPTGVKEKVVRYTYSGGTLTSPMILLDNIKGWVNHNGSRLLITPDLKLFITTGDAADLSTPQNDNSINGKILRINLDGSIPSDNPSPSSPVWSKGHRNPQGMVYANDKLYVTSHGDGTDDEINLILKNRNYGYPDVVGPCDTPSEQTFCIANNVVEPIFTSGNVTWAFCGLDFYNNSIYPEWQNKLLMVSLKNQTFYVFTLNNDGTAIIGQPVAYYVGQFGRLRDIAISPSGRVYLCTNNGSDQIIEISPVVD